MPLLGRHKSLSGSSSATQQQQPTTPTTTTNSGNQQQQQQQRRQQVCESPLFGVRRQLPMSLSSVVSGTNTTQMANTTTNELSSVPQQITRQQIHYAFAIMDTNKDGMIDLRDLSQMLSNLGVPIDEAILSHIMSSVSKRGDHRISENEFLNWIAHFIQVSDGPSPLSSPSSSVTGNNSNSATATTAAAGRKRGMGLGGSSTAAAAAAAAAGGSARRAAGITRSSTASSSLIAQQNEMPRTRRGSGSGLALMRSLSSSSATAAATATTTTSSSSNTNTTKAKSSSPLSSPVSAAQSTGDLSAAAAAATNSTQATGQPTAESEARDDLKAAFCVFDLDGDGFITFDEVRAGLKLLGESWSPNELRQLFSKCNRSSRLSANDLSKQRISIDDFVQLLL